MAPRKVVTLAQLRAAVKGALASQAALAGLQAGPLAMAAGAAAAVVASPANGQGATAPAAAPQKAKGDAP